MDQLGASMAAFLVTAVVFVFGFFGVLAVWSGATIDNLNLALFKAFETDGQVTAPGLHPAKTVFADINTEIRFEFSFCVDISFLV